VCDPILDGAQRPAEPGELGFGILGRGVVSFA